MTKLDWSRASIRTADPARFQKIECAPAISRSASQRKKRKRSDQSEPLAPARMHEARKGKLNQVRKQEKLAKQAAERKRHAQKTAAKAERRELAKAQQREAAARKLAKDVERRAREEARKAAFAEYQRTPAYAAEVARKAEAMAAKKKSHLQAWVESKTQLGGDREELRKRWRSGLLKEGGSIEVTPTDARIE